MLLLRRASGLVLIAALAWCGVAHADGKGKGGGLARALSKAGGKGGSSAGLSRASQNLTRTGGSLGRSGLGKAKGLSAGSLGAATDAATDAATRHQKQLVIEQRNRDQRLAQAEHLRQIAERNGDAELAANAERMAAFAEQHYQDRLAQLARFGVTDPALTPAPQPAPDVQPASAPLPSAPQP